MKKKALKVLLGSVLTLSIAASSYALEPVEAGFGKIKLDGLLQGRFTANAQAGVNDEFSLRRGELKLSGSVNEKIDYFIMIDPARAIGNGEGASTTTDVSANKQQKRILQDFGINLKHIPYTTAVLGQFKIPFSMEGLASSGKQYTVERSQINTRGNYGDFRDLGLQVTSGVDVAKLTAGIFNGEGQDTVDKNEYKDIGTRLSVDPVKGLHFGYANYYGKSGTAKSMKVRNGFEFEYTHDLGFISAEFALGNTAGVKQKGWYAIAGYNIIPDLLQVVIKGDSWDPDTKVSNDRLDDIVLGVNLFMDKHNAKFQINYIKRMEEGKTNNDKANDQIIAQLQVAF